MRTVNSLIYLYIYVKQSNKHNQDQQKQQLQIVLGMDTVTAAPCYLGFVNAF